MQLNTITGVALTFLTTFSASTMAQTAEVHPAQAPPTAPLIFDHVTVVDVISGHLLPNQRVAIAGNHIMAVAPSRGAPPAGARVVDARGKYLIPGLWDMHVHVDDKAPVLYPEFIAYGITGLREMAQRGQFPDSFPIRQREIIAGTLVGPRVYGPSFDMCKGGNVMRTQAAAHHLIDSLKAAGDVFLKIHSCLIPRDDYFMIAREARRAGLQFVGHVPNGVSEIEALDSGQVTLEHTGDQNQACWSRWPVPLDTLAPQRCAPSAAAYRRNQGWMDPTLIAEKCAFPGALGDAQQFVGIMYRLGVPLLAGTDFPLHIHCGNDYPPLHDELSFLVGAGLTPLEALRSATLNPAQYMHATDSLGTIAPGKLADLDVLDANPLADIHNTRQIHAVVANGRYFDSTALAALRGTLPPPQLARLSSPGDVDTQAVYLGYRRGAARFVSPGGVRHDAPATYAAPSPSQLDTRRTWGLVGPWRVTSERATLMGGPGTLILHFRARHLILLCSQVLDASGRAVDSTEVRYRVLVDGKPPVNQPGYDAALNAAGEGNIFMTPRGQRPIRPAIDEVLIAQSGPVHDQTIEIEFLTPVTVYEFTFDPGS